MLRGIDPILSPDLLRVLRAMGHGDDIVIADANFPAAATARRLVRLDGLEAQRVLKAVLSIMPLDAFVEHPAITMQVVGEPTEVPQVVQRFQSTIDATADRPARILAVERFDFYARAKEAFAIVQTGERRLYGNIILKKGIVAPEEG